MLWEKGEGGTFINFTPSRIVLADMEYNYDYPLFRYSFRIQYYSELTCTKLLPV